MAHIYTYEEIKQEFSDRGYILITDHKLKCSEKYEYVCNKHQDKGSQFIDWGHFHSGHRGCYYCGREKVESGRRKNLSEYNGKELAEEKGFEYVGMSKHEGKVWVQFICPNHREYGIQEMGYFNMRRVVVGCQHCIGRNDDEEIVLKKMYDANPNIILLEPYGGKTKRTKALCLSHNEITYTTPNNVIHGKGCHYCGTEKLSALHKIPKEVFVQRLQEKHPNISLIEGYECITSVITVECNRCGNQWSNRADYVLYKGCVLCDCSTTESKVGDVLKDNGLLYTRQFTFEDCKDKRPLPFDYYLDDYNVLIEYDGEGHYQPVNFGGIDNDRAMQQMLYTQSHDKIKTEYCTKNNIPLVRIPYWEKNNLEEYLMNELKQYV